MRKRVVILAALAVAALTAAADAAWEEKTASWTGQGLSGGGRLVRGSFKRCGNKGKAVQAFRVN
jgi:opacity protein-like surface antigen